MASVENATIRYAMGAGSVNIINLAQNSVQKLNFLYY